MTATARLNLTEEEIYRRIMARITELMTAEPELGSRDGIELDHLTAACELYERVKWPMGRPSESLPSKPKLSTDEIRALLNLPGWHRPDETAIRDFLGWVDAMVPSHVEHDAHCREFQQKHPDLGCDCGGGSQAETRCSHRASTCVTAWKCDLCGVLHEAQGSDIAFPVKTSDAQYGEK